VVRSAQRESAGIPQRCARQSRPRVIDGASRGENEADGIKPALRPLLHAYADPGRVGEVLNGLLRRRCGKDLKLRGSTGVPWRVMNTRPVSIQSKWQIEWKMTLARARSGVADACQCLCSACSGRVSRRDGRTRLFMLRRRSTVRFRKGSPQVRGLFRTRNRDRFAIGSKSRAVLRHPGMLSRIGKRSGFRDR
jgi:hypothetical protein